MLSKHRVEIVAVVAIVLLLAFYARSQYIPTWADRHLEVAEEKWDLPISDAGAWFSAWTLGDGQAFAVIAADPLGTEFGETLRDPGYRFARAGYSWLAWAASGGQPSNVPYGLALIGGLAVVGTLFIAVSQRERLGPRAWLLVLNPAMYIGFAGDTAEPLAILLLTAALATGGWYWSLALGVTRPTYLLALIGRWRVMGVGVLAAGLLAAYSILQFGLDTMTPGDVSVLTLPLVGYLSESSLAGWALALLSAGTLTAGVRRRDWAWVVGGTFILCLAPIVLADPVNAWRAAGLLPVLWAFGPNYRPAPPLSAATSKSVVSV